MLGSLWYHNGWWPRKRRLRVYSRFFNLHRDFSTSLALSNASELFLSWIPINHIQVQKEKENFVIDWGGLLADKSLSSGCIREINCVIHWLALSTFRTTGPRSWLRWRSTQLMLIEAKVRRVSSAYINVYEADSGKTIWEVVNTNKKVSNSRGPRIVPWGMPQDSEQLSDKWPSTKHFWLRSLR